ncbi:tail fiber protein [Escherichia coli]|nr:tail fiber protein [Escherichia coli]
MSASPVVKTGEEAKYHLIQKNISKVGLGEGSALPVGVPVPWPSATPPKGWLKCNGAPFSAEEYPELAKAYPTNKLPDLRGEFIRGWDDGRGADSGRALLSSQTDQLQNHGHGNIRVSYNGAFGGSGALPDGGAQRTGDADLVGPVSSTNFAGGQPRVGAETRPRNVAFNYIVRAV